MFLLCSSDFGRSLEESRDDLQSPGYDTPVPLIRSDSYTTLLDATQTYLTDEARAATYQEWVHHLYNHHRPHTGIGGKSPIERLSVHNLTVKNN